MAPRYEDYGTLLQVDGNIVGAGEDSISGVLQARADGQQP